MAQAQKEPSLLQRDLLAGHLARSDLQVIDVPINPKTKSRLCKPDRLVFTLLEAELCKTVRANQRVNALSPLVDSKGQWALNEEAVSQWTPIATV